MPKRIECDWSIANVAVCGKMEYRRDAELSGWVSSRYGTGLTSEFLADNGAKFYKEVLEPCVVRFDDEGREPGLGHYWRKWYWGDVDAFTKAANRTLLVLLLKEGADAQKVYEQVLKVEGVEA